VVYVVRHRGLVFEGDHALQKSNSEMDYKLLRDGHHGPICVQHWGTTNGAVWVGAGGGRPRKYFEILYAKPCILGNIFVRQLVQHKMGPFF